MINQPIPFFCSIELHLFFLAKTEGTVICPTVVFKKKKSLYGENYTSAFILFEYFF